MIRETSGRRLLELIVEGWVGFRKAGGGEVYVVRRCCE